MFCACCTYIELVKANKITLPEDLEQAETELREALYHNPQKQPKPCSCLDHVYNHGYANGMLLELHALRAILKGNKSFSEAPPKSKQTIAEKVGFNIPWLDVIDSFTTDGNKSVVVVKVVVNNRGPDWQTEDELASARKAESEAVYQRVKAAYEQEMTPMGKKFCNCAKETIMASGCQCGGK